MKVNFPIFKPTSPVIPCESQIIQKSDRNFTAVVTSPLVKKCVTVNSISDLVKRLETYQRQRGK